MTRVGSDSYLGQPSHYPQAYTPALLYPVSRAENRETLARGKLPFQGVDIWNAYELSWLDARGKPVVATGELTFPADSPNLIESKSLKLYLNSLNQTRFETTARVLETIQRDLSNGAGAAVQVRIDPMMNSPLPTLAVLPGECLDGLDIDVADYDVNPDLLGRVVGGKSIFETLHSHLFKSNCPVTGQPDWASILIRYRGPAIEHAHLLRYLVSYRNCSAFHEHCVESVFVHILERCQPEQLTVYGRYTRRGGLDINPFRSNFEFQPSNLRLPRQ